MISVALLTLVLQAASPSTANSPATDQAGVLATIDAVFAALEAGDGAALLDHVYAEGRLTAVGVRRDGSVGARRESFAEYSARLKLGQGFTERITDPVIAVDADIATVWAPFTVTRGGKLANCGVDHFDLVREGGVWKVMNLTFSSRTSNCLPASGQGG